MEKLKDKKVLIPIIIAIVAILLGVVIILINIVNRGKLTLNVEDDIKKGITFERIIPMSDVQGLATKEYNFSVTNGSRKNTEYKIYLDDIKISGEKRMDDSNIRYSLTENGSEENPKDLTDTGKNPNRILDSSEIKVGSTNSYTLKIWLKKDISEDDMMTVFKAKLRMEEISK